MNSHRCCSKINKVFTDNLHENISQICCSLFISVATAGISAELNPLFQDNAVLQCDQRVPVWGVARDGEKITVAFAGQKFSTVATNGAWKIWLKPMKPNATPQTLTVAGDTTSAITNSLSGRFPMKTSMRGLTMGL